MGKIGGIIQARMGSTRLPGKVAKKLAGKPMLAHVIERLKESEELDRIIVATSEKDQDNKVVEIAEKEEAKTYRGSETDVLSRYIDAAKKYELDVIVRVTGDCPLIDPVTVDGLVKKFVGSENLDYMGLEGYPLGLDTGICTLKTLKKVDEVIRDIPEEKKYREHVTLYIYQHPDEFEIGFKSAPEKLNKNYRLSVDEVKDFELMKEIYDRLYDEGDIINIEDVLDLLEKNPRLAEINTDVNQKKY